MGTASASTSANIHDHDNSDGIIPRAVSDLFQCIQKDPERSISVKMSFLEIYNEEARDLLSGGTTTSADKETSTAPSLFIREGADGGVYVQNLTWKEVSSEQDVAKYMDDASEKRVVASTQMNAVSSRSHAICTLQIHISNTHTPNDPKEIKSKLTLVDLAGSERVKRTGAEGNRLKEGININKGLFVLGQVVSCLSQTTVGEKKASHIPYRDSKLTRLLQDSLGGNSRTIMLACVSPADSNAEESINTLRYASRARSIQNAAVQNIVETALAPKVAAALRNENQTLRQRVIQLESMLRETTKTTSQTFHKTIAGNEKMVAAAAAAAARIPSSTDTTPATLIASLQCKVDRLQEQIQRSAQDALQSSLRSDRIHLQYEELLAKAQQGGIELAETKPDLSLVQKLRQEIAEWKQRESDALIDAEVARATAAAVVSADGNVSEENLILLDTASEEDEEANAEATAQLTTELLCLSGDIDTKEEIVRKALLESQLIEKMKSNFESALQTLQMDVEKLSTERDNLLAIVDSVPDEKGPASQMKSRIKILEKKINSLKSKAAEHQKSLRLREMAETRAQKLEQEIKEDKKRKAELQKKLKEESKEHQKEKKHAKLQAAKMLKDSQNLKLELQKVKMAAERQATVLRQKTTELLKKQKRERAASKKKRNKNSESSRRDVISMERQEELLKWLDSEIDAIKEIAATSDQILDHELLLDETLQKINRLSELDDSVIEALEEEQMTRKSILEQLRENLQALYDAQVTGMKDVDSWNIMSEAEKNLVISNSFERLNCLQMESDATRQQERVEKAVTRAKEEERQTWEDVILKLRLEHSEAMSSLLDSTRMALEEDIKIKHARQSSQGGDGEGNIDIILEHYFKGANAATTSIKNEIEQVKSHRDTMQSAVDQLTQGMIKSGAATKTAKRKRSFEEILDTSFMLEDLVDADDGNDSDWSPEDDIGGKNKRKLAVQPPTSIVNENTNKENSQEPIDSLKVPELKEKLRSYGLKLSGKKVELQARLKEFLTLQDSESENQHKSARRPLQPMENPNNASFMQDNTSFSVKRRGAAKLRLNMNNAVQNAMIELSKL